MQTVRLLSGIGDKGPACMQLTLEDRIWLLDCGFGPEANAHFNPEWLKGAEAVFITHDHIDHIGGASHAVEAGLPIYATPQTAKSLPPAAKVHLLPEQGETVIDGVTLTTGRNGHAMGGVWMHFALGEGFFYSGDWSEESDWFPFDLPPPAATAILDCSYHLDDVPQSERFAELDALLEGLHGQVLLPVPPSGRAGEMALHLIRRFGVESVMLDPECQAALKAALASQTLSPDVQEIAPLLERGPMEQARFLICDTPNADGGAAWGYVRAWNESGRLGRDAHVVFTGHMTAHARGICAVPGGYFQRWNVHPPLRDQVRMLERLGAKRFAPAFCAQPEDYLVEDLGVEIFLHDPVRL